MDDVQRALLEVLYYLGFEWLAKDPDGDTHAFEWQPRRRENEWNPGYGRYKRIVRTSPLQHLVSWEAEPLDIGKALGEKDD